MPPSKICQPNKLTPPVNHTVPIIIPTLYSIGASAQNINRPTACWILAITAATAKINGLTAITCIILTAKAWPDSLRPGAIKYFINGSAKIIISTDAAIVISAMKLIMLELICQADCLLPLTQRSLKTGMNVTLSAPETSTANIKSGTMKAAV